jgi:hypothetical protein
MAAEQSPSATETATSATTAATAWAAARHKLLAWKLLSQQLSKLNTPIGSTESIGVFSLTCLQTNRRNAELFKK